LVEVFALLNHCSFFLGYLGLASGGKEHLGEGKGKKEKTKILIAGWPL